MGRPSWATSEQLEFLHSHIPKLSKARDGIGLNVTYRQIAQDFLTHWKPEPVTSHTAPTTTPEELEVLTMARHYKVCLLPPTVYSTTDD